MTDYKLLQESFVSDNPGTSKFETLMAVSFPPILLHLVLVVEDSLPFKYRPRPNSKSFLLLVIEFLVLIVPLILSYTIFSSYIYLFTPLTLIFYYSLINYSNKSPNQYENSEKPFLSYYRSFIGIFTVLCILAVDFPIFPRRFGKTETYGYSLMDTGVGYYVISNGIVTKPKMNREKSYTYIFKAVLDSIPLLILGFIRFLFISEMAYQTHDSEYGVHWNFFFTLAFIKIISSAILTFSLSNNLIIFLTISIHHILLTYFGLEKWCLDIQNGRDNLLTANREGILSLSGYVCLYFIGLEFHRNLFIKKNGHSYEEKSISFLNRKVKFLMKTFVVLVILTYIFEIKYPCSRRLANLTYVTWMTAVSTYSLLIAYASEMIFRAKYKYSKHFFIVPLLIKSINHNGLLFFLIANLLTGLVNLMFKTLFMNTLETLTILIIYMFLNCLFVYILYKRNIKLKFGK